jgi:hypothetical protein
MRAIVFMCALAVAAAATAKDDKAYQHGTVTKVRTEVLAESRVGITPPTPDEPRTSAAAETSDVYYLYIRSGTSTYVARVVGESGACKPDDFKAGPIDFRLAGSKMFLKCPNGRGELQGVGSVAPQLRTKQKMPKNNPPE